jgi:general secretion pathway protein F
MKTATLDDFMALNNQLAALAQAGVPLDLGLGRLGKDPAGALQKINATVSRRVNEGESLVEALDGDEQVVPTAYRSMVQLGLRSGTLSAALNGSNRLAESVDDSRHAVSSALFYPLVVCGLAYLGLVGFCFFFVPTLEGMYHTFRIRPGLGLRVLQVVRDTLPYWIAIPPLALLLFVASRIYTKRHAISGGPSIRFLARLPGASKTIFQQRCANFSESLATLVNSGVPLEEGLRLAAGACGDADLSEGARALAAAIRQGRFPNDDSSAALQFPPFLRWALWHSESTIGRGRALQMAAATYRESAEHRTERLRIIAPIVTCVFIGGTAALLYGLALFVPVVDMLRALTR